tara:strand:+ start:9215 stop:10264 length:1050 start_codon:yes stop_codon:yes gene_type:complete
MKTIVITGSNGLVGSESVKFFLKKGFKVLGIDNDMRSYFFGKESSTLPILEELEKLKNYEHFNLDIRDHNKINQLFKTHSKDIVLVIHAAAQPSHDWAAKEPHTDFTVNANGTLILLEATRKFAKEATFIFTSTNKVYGDTPNTLPLLKLDNRLELPKSHIFYSGIDESMSIDQSKHSIFGASKLAADILVQEYGKYFNMNTVSFRGGCLTGPAHKGAELHGFLAYIIKAAVNKIPYTIFGYEGKQVRDNIHSYDLVNAFWHFHNNPKQGEVYNIGGSRVNSISMLEVIEKLNNDFGHSLDYTISDKAREGDHKWYISDVSKFKTHYPGWGYKYLIDETIEDIVKANIK